FVQIVLCLFNFNLPYFIILTVHIFPTGENIPKLEITPLNSVIHVGEDLKITCKVIDCPVNATFVWTSAMDKFLKAEIKNEHNVSHLLMRNISIHSDSVKCQTTCDRKILQKIVFSAAFPEDPVLPKIKSLIANQEQKLICTVPNIYPLERFQIEWFRGDKSLHKEELDLQNSDKVQNYSSVFNYTPSVDDQGKNISCKATLYLNSWVRTTTAECKSLLKEYSRFNTRNDQSDANMRTCLFVYGPGTVTVSSNNTSVKLGEQLEITCHADGNPKPKIFWWKLGETEPEHQSQNNKLIISNASWSQAGWYRCNASNNVGSQQMSVKVISQSAATGGPNESAVLLNISSIQITDAGIYICEAKNDFGIETSKMNITVKGEFITFWRKFHCMGSQFALVLYYFILSFIFILLIFISICF
uniref:Vascular cell adhesion molecule 1a n=1 Tax=Cyprinus carpio carpio TaxID=630221 RepID=A0A9J8CWI2_CYPCA